MAGFSGRNGKIRIGSSDLAEITSWSFNPTANNPSWASSTSPGFKVRECGVRDGTVSFEGKYDVTDRINERFQVGDKVIVQLFYNATEFFTAPIIIDGITYECDMDDGEVFSFSVDASTDGAWTQA